MCNYKGYRKDGETVEGHANHITGPGKHGFRLARLAPSGVFLRNECHRRQNKLYSLPLSSGGRYWKNCYRAKHNVNKIQRT